MSNVSNIVYELKPERRLCEVDGELGYFHCWEQYVGTNPLLPCSSRVFGIVEFADCVRRIDPACIKFVDDENHELAIIEKDYKKVKEIENGNI